MTDASMKKNVLITVLTLLFLVWGGSAFSGDLADKALLEILESKGFLTEKEVREVKAILEAEQKMEKRREKKGVAVVYDEGLRIRSRDGKRFTTRIGGRFETDLLVFKDHYPVDNDFDIRRARFFMTGRFNDLFSFRFEAELEGGGNNRLVDAYIDFDHYPFFKIRAGQFKEPFSFETYSSDRNIPFNELSMISYLTPSRDVGVMVHGNVWHDFLNYGIGVFNGDGRDASRRSQKDEKEVTGRLVVRPFRHWGPWLLDGLQIGGSWSRARLDTSDFNLKVKTPARTTFFTVQARAKFHITQEVDELERMGFELVYTFGPLMVMGEYINSEYSGVKLADGYKFDFELDGWYAGVLLMLTGERPQLKNGRFQKIRPRRPFEIGKSGWGALGIVFRYQEFEGDSIVYRALVYEGYSIRKAKAFTIGLNWYLTGMVRLSIDYSRTQFDAPVFLGTHWKGYSYYEDVEHAWLTRLQVEF